jgi:hypothetical protein
MVACRVCKAPPLSGVRPAVTMIGARPLGVHHHRWACAVYTFVDRTTCGSPGPLRNRRPWLAPSRGALGLTGSLFPQAREGVVDGALSVRVDENASHLDLAALVSLSPILNVDHWSVQVHICQPLAARLYVMLRRRHDVSASGLSSSSGEILEAIGDYSVH